MDQNEDKLYQERILDNFEMPYHRGVCNPVTHRHEDDSPLCGDVVRIELEIDKKDRRVKQAYFDGDGCCISQAAASILVREVEGKSVEEVASFSAEQMLELFRARLTSSRQKCCLLPWRVLQVALRSPVTVENQAADHQK